jgi:two-component system phosphate regulon sensor histidine kinase PhoR
LTSISGFIETLQAGASEDPEIRTKFIDIIAIETARLKRLIEDLLVLSDIENKRDIDEKKFSISTSIENTTNTLNLIAEEKNIELILDLDDSLYIKGSADRFGQMMVNLIENAIKYSEPGGRVWVKSQDTGDSIEVSVKDEGIGIAPEHHDRLFERFYRVDKSRSKKVGGTGLGLSIVKHIAMLFDAKLRVESQIGEGTTFYVTFMKDEEKEHNT